MLVRAICNRSYAAPLDAMVVEGIKTTIPLHLKIMDSPDSSR